MRRLLWTGLSVLIFCSAAFAQSFQFQEGAFVNPSNGNILGLGTGNILFQGSPEGTLSFTANSGVSASSSPFLLGRIDFAPGGETPNTLQFRLGFDTSLPDGSNAMRYFCPPLTSVRSGELGFREVALLFSGSTWTSDIDGTNHTLSLLGVTSDTTWDPDRNLFAVQGVVGESIGNGFVWATLGTSPPGTAADGDGSIGCGFEPDDCGCHCDPPSQVPEPATWMLAGLGLLVFGGYRVRQLRRPPAPVN